MPGVTDYSDDDEPPPPQALTRGVPHNASPQSPDLDEPPPPPALTRSSGFGYSGMHRRPSPRVAGDEWTREWVRESENDIPPRDMPFEPPEVPIPGIHRSMEEDWWFTIPHKLRTDDFWKYMFAQPDFFLVNKKIDQEQKEAIDTIMSLLPIEYKGIYNTSTRRQPLKSPFPEQVNVAYVKQYLNNVRTTLSLTPEDRYRFEMILMNYLMFAPMKVLKRYIARIPRRGGKRRTRKYKSKRV